jgi:hypothetical protein
MPVTYCSRPPHRAPSFEELEGSEIYHITVREDDKGRPVEIVICAANSATHGEPYRYALDIYADYMWEESHGEEYTVDVLNADVDWAECDDCPLGGEFTDEKWLRTLGRLRGTTIRRIYYSGAFESTDITIYASFSYMTRPLGLSPFSLYRWGCYELHASVESEDDERYLELELREVELNNCYTFIQLR